MQAHARIEGKRIEFNFSDVLDNPPRVIRKQSEQIFCRIVVRFAGPFAPARLAFGDAWSSGLKFALDSVRSGCGLHPRLPVEFADRDAQPVDLREGEFAVGERRGDPAALRPEPVRIIAWTDYGRLDRLAASAERQRKPAAMRCTSTQSGPSVAPRHRP